MFEHSQYVSSKHDKSTSSGKSKACNLQESKGMGLECANAMKTQRFLAWFRYVVLSYIHVDGDSNPQRVMVVRVHRGLHP